jgi:2-polyprenyl-3-methyl-5-hydroxy-6-metoxy-1,4-benzoquinol methylase
MRDHLQSIAEEAAGLIESPSATVLDIGCNDGTLLGFYPNSFSRFGIDPSNAVTEITTDATVIQDLFPSEQLTAAMEGRRFDVITSIAMFYDLEEPIAFASAIRDHLAVDGIWIFEMSYMPAMLSMLSYDTICHEHLEYYSLAVVETILQSAALEIFAVSMNSINGGSIRCLATHAGSAKYRTQERRQELDVLRTREFDLALDTDRPYQRFQEQVEAHRDELSGLVKELKRSGNRIHVYGASTKGNTILQFCGLDNGLIDFAADRNPAKHGCRTLGTNVPIISEEESRSLMPDYYLVLPWHFKPEFLQREKPMLDQGVKMIFPLPTIEVYP